MTIAMEKDKKRKYVLFKQERSGEEGGVGGLKPCAFFMSTEGCRNGSNCKFYHGTMPLPTAPPIKQSQIHLIPGPSTKADVHGGSHKNNFETKVTATKLQNPVVYPPPPHTSVVNKPIPVFVSAPINSLTSVNSNTSQSNTANKEVKEKVKKSSEKDRRITGSNSKQHEATPIIAPIHHSDTDDEEADSNFLFGVVNKVINSNQSSPAFNPKQIKSSDIFVQTNQVNSLLETSGTEHATLGPNGKSTKKRKSSSGSESKQYDVADHVSGQNGFLTVLSTLPISKPISSVQPTNNNFSSIISTPTVNDTVQNQSACLVDPLFSAAAPYVHLTVTNSRFQKDYDFPTDSTWVKSKAFGDWCKNLPPIIAIDCEMCETTDPVTSEKQSSLIRFSIISGLNHEEVILDTLVAPNMPISDMRTQIHGITEENLKGVTFTLRHAQAALSSLVCERTVIVGHALYNDLKALKFNHQCVLDTAYVFKLQNEPNSSPAMRDIAESVLGMTLDVVHDSVKDAQCALFAARHLFLHGVPSPIARSGVVEHSLLVHRIPSIMNENHIKEMFISNTFVVPTQIVPIVFSSDNTPSGKTTVMFETVKHSDLAFDTLAGPNRPDKANRAQKRVYIKGGGYICVRKNTV